jgi:hypothetical protein
MKQPFLKIFLFLTITGYFNVFNGFVSVPFTITMGNCYN